MDGFFLQGSTAFSFCFFSDLIFKNVRLNFASSETFPESKPLARSFLSASSGYLISSSSQHCLRQGISH